eukprot:5035259-Prymnesium_polylepis.2
MPMTNSYRETLPCLSTSRDLIRSQSIRALTRFNRCSARSRAATRSATSEMKAATSETETAMWKKAHMRPPSVVIATSP